MNSRLLLTVVVLAVLALLALIGLQRALEEAAREREESQPAEESAPPAVSPSPDGDSAAAAGWFYQAALHGRVYALTQVGEALSWRGGLLDAPVELGWVDQDAWETMTTMEKSYRRPVNVYAKTVYDVAPALSTGLGELGYRLSLQGSVETQALRDRIVRRFLEDQQAAGLPPVDIPAADFDLREFVERLCPGVADSLERDGWH